MELSPEEVIAVQNEILEEINAEMVLEIENKETSEEASYTLTEIQNALEDPTKKAKRSATALTTCSEFEEKYTEFLTAIISLADNEESMDVIRELTAVLEATLPAIPCGLEERLQLRENTAADAASASSTAAAYIQEREENILEIAERVREAQELIAEANQELVESGQTTIPPITLGFTIPSTSTSSSTSASSSTPRITTGGPILTTFDPNDHMRLQRRVNFLNRMGAAFRKRE